MLWARMVYRRGHAGGHALINVNVPAFDVIVAGPRYHKTRGLKNKYDRRKPGTKTNTG
jgi:hypothetical protein